MGSRQTGGTNRMVAHAKQQTAPRPRVTPQEYLERERRAETKSEYHDGVIVAMAGASPEHNILTFNLNGLLYVLLQSGNCQGFASDPRVYIPAGNRYVYPDVVVVCGEPQYQPDARDQSPIRQHGKSGSRRKIRLLRHAGIVDHLCPGGARPCASGGIHTPT